MIIIIGILDWLTTGKYLSHKYHKSLQLKWNTGALYGTMS